MSPGSLPVAATLALMILYVLGKNGLRSNRNADCSGLLNLAFNKLTEGEPNAQR